MSPNAEKPSSEFTSEGDLRTLEGWARYQGIDFTELSEEDAASVRALFESAVRRRKASERVGRMKLKASPGEARYAVAIREDDDLWLALWVRRSRRPEFFVFLPRGDRDWQPHSSLHEDGRFHLKSHNVPMLPQRKQRPGSIRGCEPLGSFGGYGPKTVGAICDPSDFSGVLEIPAGILGPRNGTVAVDLLEPGAEPFSHPGQEVGRRLFADLVPNVLIRIFA